MASKKLVLDLLEQEVEDFIQTQAEKVIEFEDDPMAYILNKYPSLKDTLTDLMTKHFGDYVTGIYVMAPKPTTFKVLLHNGQFYYLTYAKDSYIAKIQGKKYYLLDLGAEEYAIKAIADLLTMGKPPGAKGPDDQEDNVTITDTETTTDVDITDDGGGDDDLSEAKEKNPETDDYGRPFIDPKGSRTYMDPDEMTPAARARKMMGEKNEEEFKPHMMYDPKTGEGKYAKVKDDHLKLKAKGWGHDKPKRVANKKKIRIVKESVEKKKSPLKFRILKEADFKALTFFDLAKRGGFRFQILADKIKNGSAFELVGSESTPLQFINPDHADIFASGDSTEIKKLSPTKSNQFKFFKDDAGKEYSIEDLQKNKEFGGRGKGSGTVVEDYNLKLLKDQISKLKEENGDKSINVVVGGKTYSDIVTAESQFGTPKSDFNLIDSKGNPVVFISHKKAGGKGASANDFIRWSGYTMYKDHPEVKTFNEALAKWVDKNNPGEGLPNKSRFISRIKDKELIQKLIYGPKFDEGFSKDNVSIILQGKIDLNPKGNNTYELTSQHDEIPPSIPEGEYYPYLTSAYRADREMFGIKNNEAIVMTKAQSNKSSNVYELQNGEFIKTR